MENKTHRGAVVRSAITKSGVSIEVIAERINTSRRNMYNFFNKEDLSLEIVSLIGDALKYDFAEEIPEILYYKSNNLSEVDSNQSSDLKVKLSDCVKDRDFWKSRAYESVDKLSNMKDIFYQLAFEAKEKGIDVSSYISKIS